MSSTRCIFEAIDERTLSSIPEIAYLFCVAIEDYLNPQQFTGAAATPATFSLLMSIATVWNFIDGICSIVQGMKRLLKAQEDIFSMSLKEITASETFWGTCNILNGCS